MRTIPKFFLDDVTGCEEYERVRTTARARIEELWARFAPYCGDAPAAFLGDAQQNPEGRIWEMRLVELHLDAGCELEKPPRDAPDICVRLDGARLWIEAAAVGHGEGPDAVPVVRQMGTINRDAMILRYTSALEDKRAQREQFVKRGRIAKTDPFVIAINAGQIQFAASERSGSYPDIVRAVYPVSDMMFMMTVDPIGEPPKPTEVRTGHVYRPAIAKPNANTEVPAQAFVHPTRYAGVSGVMFSGSLPLHTEVAQMILVHNARAQVVTPRGRLPVEREYTYRESDDGSQFFIDEHRQGDDLSAAAGD